MQASPVSTPWWRQPWPWALIALPATMVVIGFTLLAVAMHGRDSLVTGHPYERGLRLGSSLEQAQRARQMGLSARVSWHAGLLSVRLQPAPTDALLHLHLRHPLRRSGDLDLVLQRTAPGVYQATAVLDPVVYAAQLQGTDWSLSGRWREDTPTTLWPGIGDAGGDAPQDD
ncbi:FixH family protein [Thiomonas sp.]|uniref:FixH family protein n=1 Tax=Thiomonas sp. TaxID=2047785 RepID=UPI002613927B|nr:FixH family protein [Thiomonas sp.]